MKLKVALISHSFPPLMTGGIGSYTFNLANVLSKKGVDVTVFCGGKVKQELEAPFKIRRLPMLDFPPHAVWFQLQNYKKLIKKLKTFDIIHSQNTSFTIYYKLKNKIKKPWIVSFHDCPIRGLKSFLKSPLYSKNLGDFIFNFLEYPLYQKIFSIELKNSDEIISVSYSLADDLKKNFKLNKKEIKVIQTGVNINKILEIKKRLNNKKDSNIFRILFFGRLFYGKGITFLIESMKEVVKKEKNVLLDIYGEGPLKKTILKMIKKHNLDNHIKVYNFVTNNQIIEKICESDVVVFPSLHESLPISFLEVMACSKPIIAFDYPFSREIIENRKDGILVETKNSKKLAEAILNLVKEVNLREKLGKNAFDTIKKKFDNKEVIKKYIELYRGLV